MRDGQGRGHVGSGTGGDGHGCTLAPQRARGACWSRREVTRAGNHTPEKIVYPRCVRLLEVGTHVLDLHVLNLDSCVGDRCGQLRSNLKSYRKRTSHRTQGCGGKRPPKRHVWFHTSKTTFGGFTPPQPRSTFGFTPPKPRRRAYVLNEVVCDGHSCWGSLRTGVYFGQTCLLSP